MPTVANFNPGVETCDRCSGTGCIDTAWSGIDPSCPDCDGEGVIHMSQRASTDLTSEDRQVLKFLASAGAAANISVDSLQLKRILLHTSSMILSRGILYDIQTESMGAGVYRVTLRRRN